MIESFELRELQAYIRSYDFQPEQKDRYFMKLVEELGELSEAIRKDKRREGKKIKGTIEEELYDMLYYILALANVYEIDLEDCARLKDRLNKQKYGRS